MVSKQVGAVLTILGGAFYLLGAFIGGIAVAGFFYGLSSSLSSTTSPGFGGLNFGALGTAILLIIAFGAFTGAMIIVGGALLNSDSPGRRKSGGILAICMMVIGGLPTLGGFGIGFILTLIGAIFGLTYKENSPDLVIGVQPMAAPAPPGYAPRSQSLKFCIKCGAPRHEGATFCGSCGAPFPA